MVKDKNKSWWKRQGAGRQFLIIFCVTILFFLLVAMTAFRMAPKENTENVTPVIKKNVTEAEYVTLVKNATSAASANSALTSMTATEYRQGMVSQKEAVNSIDEYYWEVYRAYCAVDDVNPPEKYKNSQQFLSSKLLLLSKDVATIKDDISLGWGHDVMEDLKTLAQDEEDVADYGNNIQ